MYPSPAELEYFIEVASTLNLSRAAEKIGISQPSLSLAMNRLEQTIGTRLLIRHKTGVSLTLAAKQLALHAQQLLQYWDNLKSKALASNTKIQGQFTLGCNSIISIYLLSTILPKLLKQYPKLQIQLKHNVSRKITEQVINLNVDIGIVINPFKHPDLIIKKLGEDETLFWTSQKHCKIQSVYSENCVLIGNMDSIQAKTLINKAKKTGIHFNRMINIDNIDVIANLTASGCGIGIIPKRAAHKLFPKNSLYPIIDSPAYTDEICLIYRNENREIQAIKTIIEAIKKFFEKD